MVEIYETSAFSKWFKSLRDVKAKGRINVRIRRVSLGHYGDTKYLREGISELRIDYGPGYRVYFLEKIGGQLIVLLGGSDKNTQVKAIEKAIELAKFTMRGS